MSVVICDVCGTSFSDSAAQCPICGCVRIEKTGSVANAGGVSGESAGERYTYVKGGRFSKKNVKKRNQQMMRQNGQTAHVELPRKAQKKDNGERGLIIAIVVLLLAIIAVASYITIRFFADIDEKPGKDSKVPGQNISKTEDEDKDTDTDIVEKDDVDQEQDQNQVQQNEQIPCTDIVLDDLNEITLTAAGAEYELVVSVLPEDTTEAVKLNSQNDAVATISENGKIVAVTEGTTTIEITCGEITKEISVTCAFESDSNTGIIGSFTEPFRLTKSDVTIKVGKSFILNFVDANDNPIPVAFENSKPTVCSIEENVVKGLEKGRSDITVNYNGVTYTCIVRVY